MCRTKWQLAVFAALASAVFATSASAAPNTTLGRAAPKMQTHTGANARPAATHVAAQHKTGQTSANAAAALAALQQAHALLAGANHDYAGHRAKAEHHITQAMHELGHQHGAKGAGAVNKGAAGQGNANKEPQAQSDAQLRQAVQLLSGLRGHLPDTHAARSHVQSALTELSTAFKIK